MMVRAWWGALAAVLVGCSGGPGVSTLVVYESGQDAGHAPEASAGHQEADAASGSVPEASTGPDAGDAQAAAADDAGGPDGGPGDDADDASDDGGNPAAACAATCAGCCDQAGRCQFGTYDVQCGGWGRRCLDCTTEHMACLRTGTVSSPDHACGSPYDATDAGSGD